MEHLQEFCSSRGVTLRIDRTAGLLRGVKLLGLTSKNGREYPEAVLARAARLYEGAKVNVNHPKGHPLAPRDYQDRLGTIRNVAARAGEGLFADLQFNPKHALAEQLLWDAQHAPENVGFSHNVQARTGRRGDRGEITVVEEILAVASVDLVADPATTRGLFESAADDRRARDVSPPMIESDDSSPKSQVSGPKSDDARQQTGNGDMRFAFATALETEQPRPGTWDLGLIRTTRTWDLGLQRPSPNNPPSSTASAPRSISSRRPSRFPKSAPPRGTQRPSPASKPSSSRTPTTRSRRSSKQSARSPQHAARKHE